MDELPLLVLPAIDLGNSQIERYGLILAAHVCLGPLEPDPVRDVAAGSRVDRLERVITAAGEKSGVPLISRPNVACACGHIASRAEERCWELLRNEASQGF